MAEDGVEQRGGSNHADETGTVHGVEDVGAFVPPALAYHDGTRQHHHHAQDRNEVPWQEIGKVGHAAVHRDQEEQMTAR